MWGPRKWLGLGLGYFERDVMMRGEAGVSSAVEGPGSMWERGRTQHRDRMRLVDQAMDRADERLRAGDIEGFQSIMRALDRVTEKLDRSSGSLESATSGLADVLKPSPNKHTE
jgi:hypothetical protein